MYTQDNTPKDGKRLGFAIVGLGDFAVKEMMPNFKNTFNCRITALVTGSKEKAQEYGKIYGVDSKNFYDYDSFDKIKDNKDIDAVYIVLPVGMHAEFTVRAAKAGKHVLCEKPMANTVEQCQQMIDACNAANVKLMIAYRCHYEKYQLDSIERIRKGELGKVQYITADAGRRVDPEDKRDIWRITQKLGGGGSLMDIGIYALNATRYLTGEEPTEITAFESTDKSDPRFKEVEDNILFTLRFPSGILASCTSSYSIEAVSHYRVFGDKAWLDLDPATEYFRHVSILGDKEKRVQHMLPEDNQFANQLDHFAECVKENKTPKTPGEEGLRDVRIILAAYQSVKEKRTISL